MQVREFLFDLHTRRPPTQSDIYQIMYWYNWFSWWWALCCSKHVEKWNKHIKKCVKLVINTNCTEMHGQQNIKFLFKSRFELRTHECRPRCFSLNQYIRSVEVTELCLLKLRRHLHRIFGRLCQCSTWKSGSMCISLLSQRLINCETNSRVPVPVAARSKA